MTSNFNTHYFTNNPVSFEMSLLFNILLGVHPKPANKPDGGANCNAIMAADFIYLSINWESDTITYFEVKYI